MWSVNLDQIGIQVFSLLAWCIMVVAVTKVYKKVIHGVAFIPLISTLLLALLAAYLTAFTEFVNKPLVDIPDYFKIEEVETTRVLLSSILTGMISLTVFGFSMMMVVTNQAASSYSPKVVDSLLNDKTNKYTLGIYIGTIVFTIITLMHVDVEASGGGLPHFAVFINILLQIISILLFISFINNIGNSVRITSIIQNLFQQTKTQIKNKDKFPSNSSDIESSIWRTYPANHSGYFQFVRINSLMKILLKHDLILKVLPLPGSYYSKPTPLFALNKKVDKEVVSLIRKNFVTYSGEVIEDNEYFGFRQLREVAVKALSPGINDPGVARICIDYLGELLTLWMCRDKNNIITDKYKNSRIILNRHDFEDMLGECFTPIKVYGKRDYTILNGILEAFKSLSIHDSKHSKKQLLNIHALALVQDADKYIDNFLERTFINDTINKMNQEGYFNLPLLEIKNVSDHFYHVQDQK